MTLRRRVGVAVHLAVVASLAAVYVLAAPPSSWEDPVMIGALVALGVIAIRTEVPLPAGITFEALSALALITVAVAGPLPALLVTLAPIAVNAAAGRERLLRAGNLANVAAYGGYALIGAAVLHAGGGEVAGLPGLGWLLIAGLAQLLVNWLLGPAIYLTFWLGHSPRTALHVLADGVPTGAVMVLLGAVTVLLIPALGVFALAVFVVIVILPQSFLAYAARTRPVARLGREAAARRYAHAIALELNLPRADRRHLSALAGAARNRPAPRDAIDYVRSTLHDRSRLNVDAQSVTERWDGTGPIGLRGTGIPLTARVLAVAQGWSDLTAAGSSRLGHHDALMHLELEAGRRLDPAVVLAAREVVAQERVSAAEPAPEPRLHRLRVPRALRRTLASN